MSSGVDMGHGKKAEMEGFPPACASAQQAASARGTFVFGGRWVVVVREKKVVRKKRQGAFRYRVSCPGAPVFFKLDLGSGFTS
jgi:hypothetical protein